MADTIKTIKENTKKLAKMAAADLADSVQMFKAARQMPEDSFKPDSTGHSPGDTISVRIPSQYIVGTSSFDVTSQIQDVKERSVDLPLDIIGTVAFDLDSQQLAHDVDIGQVYDRFVKGAVMDIAASVESQMVQKATQNTANLVGTAGSTVFDAATIAKDGRGKINSFLAPLKGMNRFFLTDSSGMGDAIVNHKNLFTFQRKEYDQGYLGEAWGFTWLENQLLYRHTNGNDVSCAVESTVVTPAEGMTTLGVDGLTTTTGTFTKGTVFTIDNVYAVHPQTKTTLPFLRQFVHTGATQTANGSGQVTLTLDEALYADSTDSRKNVSALPADEATINIVGSADTTYTQSLLFHKEAFRVCSVPLVLPTNAELAESATEDGVRIAIVRDFDVKTRKMITRLDFLGGLVPVRPRWACRVTH